MQERHVQAILFTGLTAATTSRKFTRHAAQARYAMQGIAERYRGRVQKHALKAKTAEDGMFAETENAVL